MYKFLERGRSLLETLAVLAIMGILLLASLLGYNRLVAYKTKKDTVKQVTEVAVRYQLNRVKPVEGKVPLKPIYPEAERVSSVVMKTADRGQVHIEASVDSFDFNVVAQFIEKDSCEEILRNGQYDAVLVDVNSDIENIINNNNNIKVGAQIALSSFYVKDNTSLLRSICEQTQGNDLNLLHGQKCSSKTGIGYWVDGKCSACPKGKQEDLEGMCCAPNGMLCGYCNGCPQGICKNDVCVDCESNGDCPSDKPFCDLKTYTCKPCINVGGNCKDRSDNVRTKDGVPLFCTKGYNCEPCDTNKGLIWNKEHDICECAKPLLGKDEECPNACCAEGLSCKDDGSGTKKCLGCIKDEDCPSALPLCVDGVCVGCPDTPNSNGAVCNLKCGCDGTKGLSCVEEGGSSVCRCGTSPNLIWHTVLEKCTECQVDYQHGDKGCTTESKPVCNGRGECITCQNFDLATPYWNVGKKACVECNDDSHCAERSDKKSVCNITTNACECPSGTFYNPEKKECTSCLVNYSQGFGACSNINKPVCNRTSWECQSCPMDRPKWNIEKNKCVECNDDSHCAGRGDNKSVCDIDTNTCKCSADTFWNTKLTPNKCTECLVDFGGGTGACKSREKPMCTNGSCVACSTDRPFWDETLKKCVECRTTPDCPANKVCSMSRCIPCNQEGTGIRAEDELNCHCPDGFSQRCGSTTTTLNCLDGGRWICANGCFDNTDCDTDLYCSCSGSACGSKGGKCQPCPSGTHRKNDSADFCRACGACEIWDTETEQCVSSCKTGQACLQTSCTANKCSTTGTYGCVTMPKKEDLIVLTGTKNSQKYYIPPANRTYTYTHAGASAFCQYYGMHMPTVNEACMKDFKYDSGHDCPNIVGVRYWKDENGKNVDLYTYDSGVASGDFWLANLDGCNALRVTRSCGNNHETNSCNKVFPLCTKD